MISTPLGCGAGAGVGGFALATGSRVTEISLSRPAFTVNQTRAEIVAVRGYFHLVVAWIKAHSLAEGLVQGHESHLGIGRKKLDGYGSRRGLCFDLWLLRFFDGPVPMGVGILSAADLENEVASIVIFVPEFAVAGCLARLGQIGDPVGQKQAKLGTVTYPSPLASAFSSPRSAG